MEEQFRCMEDTRTQTEKEYQGIVVDQLTRRNLSNFGIKMTSKQKVRYIPSPTKQVDLGSGWFCTITDNEIKSRHTVITCHGCPGDETDWVGLESSMGNQHRWINLVVPGFDGIDERRGSYKGNWEDMLELVVRLMDKLEIEKVVTCGHSMGSFLFTMLLDRFPERVEGFVSVAGVVDTWYLGLLIFYNMTTVSNGFNKPGFDLQKMALDNEFRKRVTRETNQRTRDINFAGVQFPELQESELFAYTKAVTSFQRGLSTLFEINQKLAPSFLKVYLFGRPDPIEDHERTQLMMYQRVFGTMRPDRHRKFSQKYGLVRREIYAECLAKHQTTLDIQNIQSNFIFHFQATGHNVHKRRPEQVSKILGVYFTVLEQLQRADSMINTKL